MKQYSNAIAAFISATASAVMTYYAWPILTQPEYTNIAWMAGSTILLIFVGFFKLLSDVLKEIL